MTNKNKWIFLFIVLGVIFIAGMYVQKNYVQVFSTANIPGKMVVYRTCDYVIDEYLHGANEGECIMAELGANKASYVRNPAYMYIIESIEETKAYNCNSPGSPSCPLGYRPKCTVVTSQDWSKVLSCTGVKTRFGDMLCDGGYCTYVNDPVAPDNCEQGEVFCYSEDVYARCLPNGEFSGKINGRIDQCSDTVDINPSCTPNWQCASWSSCISGTQTRTCTDSNNCGITSGKPAITQTCGTPDCPTGQTRCSDGVCKESCIDDEVVCSFPYKSVDGTCKLDMTLIWIIGGILLVLIVLSFAKK